MISDHCDFFKIKMSDPNAGKNQYYVLTYNNDGRQWYDPSTNEDLVNKLLQFKSNGYSHGGIIYEIPRGDSNLDYDFCSMSDAIKYAKSGRKIREYMTITHDMVWDNEKKDLICVSKTDQHINHCGSKAERQFQVQKYPRIMKCTVSYLNENRKYFLLQHDNKYLPLMIYLLIDKEEYDKLEIDPQTLHPLDPFPNVNRNWSIELTNKGIYKYRREYLYSPDDSRYHPQDSIIFREKILV